MFPIDMDENEAHYHLKMKHIIQNQAKTNRSQSFFPTSISHVFKFLPLQNFSVQKQLVFLFSNIWTGLKSANPPRWHLRRTHGLVGTCLGKTRSRVGGSVGRFGLWDLRWNTLNFSGNFSNGVSNHKLPWEPMYWGFETFIFHGFGVQG